MIAVNAFLTCLMSDAVEELEEMVFTGGKTKINGLNMMAWGDDASLQGLCTVEKKRDESEANTRREWMRVLDRIRQYEYPIDDRGE